MCAQKKAPVCSRGADEGTDDLDSSSVAESSPESTSKSAPADDDLSREFKDDSYFPMVRNAVDLHLRRNATDYERDLFAVITRLQFADGTSREKPDGWPGGAKKLMRCFSWWRGKRETQVGRVQAGVRRLTELGLLRVAQRSGRLGRNAGYFILWTPGQTDGLKGCARHPFSSTEKGMHPASRKGCARHPERDAPGIPSFVKGRKGEREKLASSLSTSSPSRGPSKEGKPASEKQRNKLAMLHRELGHADHEDLAKEPQTFDEADAAIKALDKEKGARAAEKAKGAKLDDLRRQSREALNAGDTDEHNRLQDAIEAEKAREPKGRAA